MGKTDTYINGAVQHHHERRLAKSEAEAWANDPTVEIHFQAPEPHDAPHGVNTPEQMAETVDAEPVSD